jgi:hypothetical protein
LLDVSTIISFLKPLCSDWTTLNSQSLSAAMRHNGNPNRDLVTAVFKMNAAGI